MTETLRYIPLRDSYSAVMGWPVIESKFSAGLSRRRLDVLGATHTIGVTWLLDGPSNYNRFNGFFRNTINEGIDAFLLDLISDIGIPIPHKCRVTGDLPKLTQQSGLAYWMQATLEVEPNPAFTGNIIFDGSGEFIQMLSGDFDDRVSIGETIRILDSAGVHTDGDTALDFDGLYEIDGIDPGIIHLVDPELVSASWTTLAGLTPDTYQFSTRDEDLEITVVRIPT